MRIDRLFLRLAAMYGHVWRSLYKSEEFLAFTKNEWLGNLARFEDSILDKALMNCLNTWDYPPTVPQFIEGCKAYSRQGQYEKYSTNSKPARPEVARAHLSQLKTLLNMPLG